MDAPREHPSFPLESGDCNLRLNRIGNGTAGYPFALTDRKIYWDGRGEGAHTYKRADAQGTVTGGNDEGSQYVRVTKRATRVPTICAGFRAIRKPHFNRDWMLPLRSCVRLGLRETRMTCFRYIARHVQISATSLLLHLYSRFWGWIQIVF